MAGTDHGEVLTLFEKVFGSVVEHEVIKLILQSCEWDVSAASESLLGMIDKKDLPSHLLSAADSIMKGLARRHPTSPEPCDKHDMGPQESNYPVDRMQGVLDGDDLHANSFEDLIGAKGTSPQVCTIPESTSEKPIITLPPSASAFPSVSPATPHHVQAKERGIADSPLSTSTNKSGESVSSSPSFSPLRLNKSVAAAGTLESNASQWVLAPEFVPNAFNLKSSDVGNKSGVWLQGMSSRLMKATALPPKQDVKRAQVSKKEEIINKILDGRSIMILMRGLPGSGKSSLAKEIKGINGVVLSTDDFFYDKHGKYVYDASEIGKAHQWNKHRASQSLKQGKTPIIIDNTNLQRWEMKVYVELALQYGYDVDMLEPDTPWRLSPKELAKRTSHGVPLKKIEEMKGRYELNLEIEDIVVDLQGTNSTQASPSKNSGSKVHEGVTSGSGLKGTEVTKCSPSKSPKRVPATNLNDERTAPNNECAEIHPSGEGEFDFESDDDDVVIEGYVEDEEPSPAKIYIDSGDDVIQVIQISESINESGIDIKEALSCEHKQLNDMTVSEDIENEIQGRENIVSEDLNSYVDLTDALVACSRTEEERKDTIIEGDSKGRDNKSHIYASEIEKESDAFDETKVQYLFDEASKSIDIDKSEEEWDNLVSHISGEDFSDEKFNELVSSFGSALKKQIENRGSKGISDAENCCVASESVREDFAMYDLISTMEDKTGQSLTSLVKKLAKSDGAIDIPLIENTGEEKASIFAPSSTELEAENLSISLAGLKLIEKGPDIPDVASEECNKPMDNDQEHITKEPLLEVKCEEKEKDEDKQSEVCYNDSADHAVPGEVRGPFSPGNANLQIGNESLGSWECVDINSGMSSVTWDTKSNNLDSARDVCKPKPSRTQRNRMPGDPSKWLKESADQNDCADEAVISWEAVERGTPQWDSSDSGRITSGPPLENGGTSSKYQESEEPQSHTGAVSKVRKHKRGSDSSSSNTRRSSRGGTVPIVTVYQEQSKSTFNEAETQTLSIDFEALQLDHNLYELKVLFGKPHYVPVSTVSCNFTEKGPLTKGGLRLEKGTMTDNLYESSVSSFQNLVAFFPNIPKEDLRDVYEKCRYDSDWAMNVLLDSGYEMSDPSDVILKETEVTLETDSVSETTCTDDGKNDESSCDTSDVAFDNFVDERTRKIRQSQQPDDLAKKLEIEKSFTFSESVDDRVSRLTGKQYSDLNISRVRKSRKRKQHEKGNSPPVNTKVEECVEGEGEGAQYVTLVMDPLFASQLNMMFGPVGDCEISGDLTFEDRSVVLPLEICEMIHKYWARTVNGKFNHEAEILDSLVRQDEILARKLQEEENAAFNLDDKSNDTADDGLLEDKPVCFQEIMDLEQALQESLADKSIPEDTSISSILSLKRLYKEYPHVHPVALKEEYTRNGCKYHITVQKLNQRFGKEQGTPKTVIAPEALSRYEQEMIERVQQDSLAEEEVDLPSNEEDDIVPVDPQVFRDEAQAHYHQRQEAFQKAQEASRRGMKAAAAYYAYIGNLHSEKLREANQRASQKILEAQNAHRKDANCLDLHLLHVPEARSATQAFLHERQRVLIARGIRQMEVSLITGRGAHSVGGQAVLKPAIKEHLQKNGYSFYEVNSGMLKVILRAKPS